MISLALKFLSQGRPAQSNLGDDGRALIDTLRQVTCRQPDRLSFAPTNIPPPPGFAPCPVRPLSRQIYGDVWFIQYLEGRYW